MFDTAFINFGVVRIQNGHVCVYSAPYQYILLHGPNNPVDARWAGNSIVVEYADGLVCRWTSPTQYQLVR